MRKISPNIRKKIFTDPFYRHCSRGDEDCKGRITIEHVLIHAGRQIDALWNLIPLCEYHHGVCMYQDAGDLNKEVNTWIALNRASGSELYTLSKAINYLALRERLNLKYGEYLLKGAVIAY